MIGSSTDAARRGRLKEFGADLAVDSSDPGWVDQVLKATNGEGVDLIVDQVSGPVANQNLKSPRSRAASSMSAGSAAPTPISTSTCMPRAGSTISASPSAPARSRKSARSLARSEGYLAGGGIAKAAIADRQGVCVRRDRQGIRAHGGQQASRQDRGDVVGDCKDDAEGHPRRRALFRGPTLACGTDLVRRLHGADAAEPRTSGECEQHAKFDNDTPCGLGMLPDGRIIVLTMFRKRLVAYADGRLSLYADLSESRQARSTT